jgi:hypothetical protein
VRQVKRRIERRTVPIRRLTEHEKGEMYGLFEQYYTDVSFQCFCSDLAEKTHLFIFRSNGRLAGFSTIFRKRFSAIGRHTYLFSGDTVLHEDFWGSKVLQKSFFWYILCSKLRSPLQPVYWMLMSKGYKTYMMMRRNFSKSYPRFDSPIPPRLKSAMDEFYRLKFGEAYDPRRNLIRFRTSHGAVKGVLAAPDPRSQGNAEVAYFLGANPDYRNGTELACIAEIRFQDFLGHIAKYFLRIKKTKHPSPGARRDIRDLNIAGTVGSVE